MKTNWTQGMSEKDKEDFSSLIKNNSLVLNRLGELVKGFDLEAESASVSSKTFDNPNWALRQASLIGERSAYKKILQLLDHKEPSK